MTNLFLFTARLMRELPDSAETRMVDFTSHIYKTFKLHEGTNVASAPSSSSSSQPLRDESVADVGLS